MAKFTSADLKSNISRAYGRHYVSVLDEMQPLVLGWISLEVLDGLERIVMANQASPIAPLFGRMLDLLQGGQLVSSESAREEFKEVYFKAKGVAFPASAALAAHESALAKWTQSFSLRRIDHDRLHGLELLAHEDPTFKSYVKAIVARLGDAAKGPNVTAYRQVFEIYSEALVFQFLRTKVLTARVDEQENVKTPDFMCELEGGRRFFVEVKSFDVVGGDIRQDQMMVDTIDQALDLERQLVEGKAISTTQGEFAPYKKADKTVPYDPRSLLAVIAALREKFVQAFKSADQFEMGPTLALGVTDRLILPSGAQDLAPYYPDFDVASACASGVLWHAAFGRPGTPIFRSPDFAGHANLEGHLATLGFLVDGGRPFPGLGAIALERTGEGDRAWGLLAGHEPQGDWQLDETVEALSALCDRFNDEANSWLDLKKV